MNISSKALYKFFLEKVSEKSSCGKSNLSNIYNLMENDWNVIYKNLYECTSDNKLRELQYRILNNYIVLNPYLVKVKKIETNLCSFCDQESETMEHFFCNCEK